MEHKLYNKYDFDSLDEYYDIYGKDYNIKRSILDLLDSDTAINTLNKILNYDDSYSADDYSILVDSLLEDVDFVLKPFDENGKADIEEIFELVDGLLLDIRKKDYFVNSFFNKLKEIADDSFDAKALFYLFSSNSLRNNAMVRHFLKNYNPKNDADAYVLFNNKVNYITYLKNLYNLYDISSEEMIEKINYIFKSCGEILFYFLHNPSKLTDYYFNDKFFSYFSKETLSFLFRCLHDDMYSLDCFCEIKDDKFYTILSEMSNYLLKYINRNTMLFNCLIYYFNDKEIKINNLFKLFDDYYDNYYVTNKKHDLENDDIFQAILSFILSYDVNEDFFEGNISTVNDFFLTRKNYIDSLYLNAFGKNLFDKIKTGYFLCDKDFDDLKLNNCLKSLKNVFFMTIYGISRQEAELINSIYGKYLDVCDNEIEEEDRDIFEVLKAICNVCSIKSSDDEKIKLLFKKLYEYIQQNGLYKVNKNSACPILQSKINSMYMNTYNKILYKSESAKVLYYKRGVPIVDSGCEFGMIVTAMNAVTQFYNSVTKIKSRYNSSLESDNQGICCSFINNENLGVLSLKEPLLGYTDLDKYCLSVMGTSDVYSLTRCVDLFYENFSNVDGLRYFLTPKQLSNNTRYGYNEMVINRFLNKDGNNIIKRQPSYVVVYKIDDNYQKSKMFIHGVSIAKEFGIPVVLVDVPKIKENEERIINEKEEELFSSKKVNSQLLEEVITRYMNNYTGTLTIINTNKKRKKIYDYDEDFSVSGLKRFMKKVANRLKDLNLCEILEWKEAINRAYQIELERNREATQIEEFAESIKDGEFLLDDIYFLGAINYMIEMKIKLLKEANIDKENEFVIRSSYNPIITVIRLSNIMCSASFYVDNGVDRDIAYKTSKIDSLSEEDKRDYDLVISYFLGDYSENYFSNLNHHNDSKIVLNVDNDNINSESFETNQDVSPLLLNLINQFEDMDNDKFIDIFFPIISKSIFDDRYVSTDDCVACLINRKKNIRNNLKKIVLKEKEKVKKIGDNR